MKHLDQHPAWTGWVTVGTAALIFDIPERTIRTWVQRGVVGSVRDGDWVYVKTEDLERRAAKWRRRRV